MNAERTVNYSTIGDGRYFGTSATLNDEVTEKLSHINAYLKDACNALQYVEDDMENWGHFCIKHSEGGLQSMQINRTIETTLYNYYNLLFLSGDLQSMQRYHVDQAGINGLQTVGNPRPKRIVGCEGISAFTALTENCDLWISKGFTPTLKNDQETGFGTLAKGKLVKIKKGACLILPNGTFHAGSSNAKGTKTIKLFTEIGKFKPDSNSQIWYDSSGTVTDDSEGKKERKKVYM